MMKRMFSNAVSPARPALARPSALLPLVVAAQLPACAVALAAGGMRDGLLALLLSAVGAVALAAYARPAAPPAPAAPAPPPAPEDDTKLYVRRLRHDLRGALSPAMLTADRLLSHPDPTARRYGEVICQSVERAAQLLETPAP